MSKYKAKISDLNCTKLLQLLDAEIDLFFLPIVKSLGRNFNISHTVTEFSYNLLFFNIKLYFLWIYLYICSLLFYCLVTACVAQLTFTVRFLVLILGLFISILDQSRERLSLSPMLKLVIYMTNV